MTPFHFGERTNAYTREDTDTPLRGGVLSVRSRGVRNVRLLSAKCPLNVRSLSARHGRASDDRNP